MAESRESVGMLGTSSTSSTGGKGSARGKPTPLSISPAFTGSDMRMKTLPHINISSVCKHASDGFGQDMIPVLDCQFGGSVLQVREEIAKGNGSRKCTYNYEDKYNFSRIILPDSLVFDSHFESGNLYSSFRVFPEEPHNLVAGDRRHIYDLYMHNDVNTSGHTQWFYYAVSNMRVGTEVTFFIRNYSKPDSMFNEGMRPLVYSVKSKKGWVRCGTEICYFHCGSTDLDVSQQQEQPAGNPPSSNNSATAEYLKSEKEKSKKIKKKNSNACNYVLSFTYVFEHSDDVCYFAYCHPYTYSDLQLYLHGLRNDISRSPFVKKSLLCKTIAGNNCDLLTITAPAKSENELKSRVAIVFTARVHPGETNASWIMQGILDFLTSDSPEANQLRALYVFKIVPMLNPDGVINGNYRCSLSGDDLNRRWSRPDQFLHPTIYHAKELIRKLKNNWIIGLVLDIHGHSRKHGVFTYGCLPDRRLMKPLIRLSEIAKCALNDANLNIDVNDPTVIQHTKVLDVLNALPSSSAIQHAELSTADDDEGDTSWESDVSLGLVKPNRSCSLRDILAWRVKLLPRIIGASAPLFSLDSCSFKMQKAKSSTMRMVVFTELGIDCCYTIEASLAGKFPYHFNIADLYDIGKNVCKSLLTAFPSIAPTSSEHYSQEVISVFSEATQESLSFKNQFMQEMSVWKHLYKAEDCVGSGLSLLSDEGLQEFQTAQDNNVYEINDEKNIDDNNDQIDKNSKGEVKSKKQFADRTKKNKSSKIKKNKKEDTSSSTNIVAIPASLYTNDNNLIKIEKTHSDSTTVERVLNKRERKGNSKILYTEDNKTEVKSVSSKKTHANKLNLAGNVADIFDKNSNALFVQMSNDFVLDTRNPITKSKVSNFVKIPGQLALAGMLVGQKIGGGPKTAKVSEKESSGLPTDSLDLVVKSKLSFSPNSKPYRKGGDMNLARTGSISNAYRDVSTTVSSPIRSRKNSSAENDKTQNLDVVGALFGSLSARGEKDKPRPVMIDQKGLRDRNKKTVLS